jgi:hypothetical protein
MDWFEVFKIKQIVTPTTKISQRKEPVEEEEDNCNRKLKAYADKVRNLTIETEWDNIKPYDLGLKYRKYKNEESTSLMVKEWTHPSYTDDEAIPENVACAALDYIQEIKHTYLQPPLSDVGILVSHGEEKWHIWGRWNTWNATKVNNGEFYITVQREGLSSLFSYPPVHLNVEFEIPKEWHNHPSVPNDIISVLTDKVNWRDN